ncbi:MAG: CocE/NonD family hydrolase [Thermomicrobiales bacterium]
MAESVSVQIEQDVPVEMRDGTVLRADVYRPADHARRPVLLQRTPYNKQLLGLAPLHVDLLKAVSRGYVVVIQDCRGRYRSDGDFNPFHQEIPDGYDTVEWCAAQSWSDGNVGMFGTSYVGAVQWLAAIGTPPGLKCMIPIFTASDYYEGWTYQGGAFQWGFMCNWVLPFLTSADMIRAHDRNPAIDIEAWREKTIDAVDHMSETARTLPLKDFPVNPEWTPYFADWLSHATRDDFWTSVSIEDRHEKIQVPALNVGGWYDIFLDGTLRNFSGVRAKGATEAARTGSRLLLGPWTHTTPPQPQSGAFDFGLRAGQNLSPLTMDIDREYFRFLDFWLRGIDDGYSSEPPARIWVMGEGVWRSENEWPLARAVNTEFFLGSDGNANSIAGDGTLATTTPSGDRPDVFLYDPFHAVPSVGGQLCCYPAQFAPGAFDQRSVEERNDVLVYTTPPLEQDVEVTGPVRLHLWAATTAVDTDFTGKVVDIAPDGYTQNLTDGIVRARYRLGTDKARPITPGEPTEYVIDLWATSNLFKRGHRIALEVSSSNFPRFDRNLNTGHTLGEDAAMVPAIQTVYHDQNHPSRLILPIVPR